MVLHGDSANPVFIYSTESCFLCEGVFFFSFKKKPNLLYSEKLNHSGMRHFLLVSNATTLSLSMLVGEGK